MFFSKNAYPDQLVQGETLTDREEVYKALHEAAEPVPESALVMMSGITFHHRQAEGQHERVFFRAYANS